MENSNNTGGGIEKRHFTRTKFNTTAVIKAGDTEVSCAVDNLSIKGIYLQCAEHIPLGTPVEVTVELTGTTSKLVLYLTGTVMRNDEQGTGIKLKNMDFDSFIHLRNIVGYNSGEFDNVLREYVESIDVVE